MVKNGIILLLKVNVHFMVENGAIELVTRLLRGITSNHHGDFYCLNCYHSCSREVRLKNMKK